MIYCFINRQRLYSHMYLSNSFCIMNAVEIYWLHRVFMYINIITISHTIIFRMYFVFSESMSLGYWIGLNIPYIICVYLFISIVKNWLTKAEFENWFYRWWYLNIYFYIDSVTRKNIHATWIVLPIPVIIISINNSVFSVVYIQKEIIDWNTLLKLYLLSSTSKWNKSRRVYTL